MKVQAKCTFRAWDSMGCQMFDPGGGPLPGGLYEIEHDGHLASLKIGQRYVKFDKDGKPVGDAIGGKYVFEFDRAAAGATAASPSAESFGPLPPTPKGKYQCKGCGQNFDSLNALGTHSHSNCPAKTGEAVDSELQPSLDQ